jgi:hypothetical protein
MQPRAGGVPGWVPAGWLILATLLAGAALLWLQPYSVISPYRTYAEPARRFLRAALTQDTVELRRQAASTRPVQWAWKQQMVIRTPLQSGPSYRTPTPDVDMGTPQRWCSKQARASATFDLSPSPLSRVRRAPDWPWQAQLASRGTERSGAAWLGGPTHGPSHEVCSRGMVAGTGCQNRTERRTDPSPPSEASPAHAADGPVGRERIKCRRLNMCSRRCSTAGQRSSCGT